MDILNNDIIITHILTKAPQLGLTCKEFYKYIPKITKNLKYPTNDKKNKVYLEKDNLKFEYEQKINLERLTKLLEHPLVKTLSISTQHEIYLEIKQSFMIIINNLSFIDNWKYKNAFMNSYNKNKYDKHFINYTLIDSIIISVFFYLYH